jgi:hypothetical protein
VWLADFAAGGAVSAEILAAILLLAVPPLIAIAVALPLLLRSAPLPAMRNR